MRKIIFTLAILGATLQQTQAQSVITEKNGNVGVGTTNPLSQFHIKNLNNVPVLNITGKTPNTGNDELISEIRLSNLYDNLPGHRAVIKAISDKSGSHGNVAFQFNTSIWNGQHTEIESMRITSNGNVGIGTNNPDEKLTVKGTIHCEEVLVDLKVPADYVFEKYYEGVSSLKATYTMPTLEEVEAFTKKNHHLPAMPSAAQIQEEGLQLKEMTNLLLQKVEELTLYTIEQEKRIKSLEAQLSK